MSKKLNAKTILLTGGAGYIGSHTYVALVEAGYCPVIIDNFSNSHPEVLSRLQQLTGRAVIFEKGDVTDRAFMQAVLQRHAAAAVVHLAGLKAVGESTAIPLKYYQNNVVGMVNLLEAMEFAECRTLVFSSRATVYGDPATVPITEDSPRSHTNPYGHTKLCCEDMLTVVRAASPAWRTGVLRYFNPVGAHPSGFIGEDPSGSPNNLMPYISQVAVGKLPFLNIYGSDFSTRDGTGVRDYIHVQDLAQGHVAAVNALLSNLSSFIVNLGTGCGHSVLEVLHAFEQVSGHAVPYRVVARRAGDVALCYADASLAEHLLGWRAVYSLAEMCADAWRWQLGNPNGYCVHVQAP